MATKHTATHVPVLLTAAAIITEVATESMSIMHCAALQHAHGLITAVTDSLAEPNNQPARVGANTKAPTSQAAAPPATMQPDASKETKPTRTAAQRSQAAVQAAKTRKENKAKTAATTESGATTDRAPAQSGDTAATE